MKKNIVKYYIILFLFLASCNDVTNKIVVDEKTGKLMLIGKTELGVFEQTEFKDWYNTEYFAYEPDDFILEQIKLNFDSLKIKIFMGTWCGDSRREVPRFIKIIDQLEFNKKHLTIINVDRKKESPNKEEKDKNIEYIPTFIIYKNDTELGRIIEFPIVTLESDLLNILMGIKEEL